MALWSTNLKEEALSTVQSICAKACIVNPMGYLACPHNLGWRILWRSHLVYISTLLLLFWQLSYKKKVAKIRKRIVQFLKEMLRIFMRSIFFKYLSAVNAEINISWKQRCMRKMIKVLNIDRYRTRLSNRFEVSMAAWAWH